MHYNSKSIERELNPNPDCRQLLLHLPLDLARLRAKPLGLVVDQLGHLGQVAVDLVVEAVLQPVHVAEDGLVVGGLPLGQLNDLALECLDLGGYPVGL